jgi:formamidopyrimidine-DNA glycosylase
METRPSKFEAFCNLISEAIAAGESSISDYVGAEGRKGSFQFSHRVYHHTGEPCVTCGVPIRRVLGAAVFALCPKYQKR